MKIKILMLIGLILSMLSSCDLWQGGKHLFILSGQSNMVGLKLDESFTPILEKEFGKENIIIVKNALGNQPIRRWYVNNKALADRKNVYPDLYDSLMNNVYRSIGYERIKTVTFIWMQGERDANEDSGTVYEKSLIGLYHQLSKDLNRKDVNFVIGRLNDFGLLNEKFPHWVDIRKSQVKIANSNPRFEWVDTDDLNEGYDKYGRSIENDLHLSVEGYRTLGKRFADKSILLIKKH